MVKVLDIDGAVNLATKPLTDKIESYRAIYNDTFFNKIKKYFIIDGKSNCNFEISILSAAECYEFCLNLNENIEPIHKSKTRVSSLQKKLVATKSEYIKFIDSPEAAIDEFFFNLDCLHEDEKYKRFFDFLHDAKFKDGGSQYNLKTIISFFDALIEAAEHSNEYFTNGNPVTKHDAISSWLGRMDDVFKIYTNIPFTQGKYHKQVGNISECLDILYEIINPLEEKITKQYLAYKLKEYNKNKTR